MVVVLILQSMKNTHDHENDFEKLMNKIMIRTDVANIFIS